MGLTVFISHSSIDSRSAHAIKNIVSQSGHLAHCTPESIPLGAQFPVVLKQQIETSSLFFVLWSANARASNWVQQEIGIAVGSKREIWPLLLDKTPLRGFIATHQALVLHEETAERLQRLRNELTARAAAHAARVKESKSMIVGAAVAGVAAAVVGAVTSKPDPPKPVGRRTKRRTAARPRRP